MRNDLTSAERFRRVLNFQSADRLPVVEWAPYWDLTRKRWEQEGLPPGMDNLATQRYFQLDPIVQFWLRPRSPNAPRPKSEGAGIIDGPEDYHRLKRDGMLYPPIDDTIKNWREFKDRNGNGDQILMLTLEGFFWFPRVLLGIENHLLAFYDNPDLMHEINSDLAAYHQSCLERLLEINQPVFMTFAEDLSYNHGPMLSPEQYDEFMLPYYQQVTPMLHSADVKVIIDSDGDVTACASWFTKAGADGILPLERQAKVDVARLRSENPGQIYIGAFDKMVMNRGEDAIRAEFERLMPVAREGGLIISCDHQTPPGVSLNQYQLYLRLFREYACRVFH